MSEEKLCQAKTSDGDRCQNKAVFPKGEPVACHLESHQKQLFPADIVEDLKEEKDMPETKEPKLHIFASKSLHHVVFVDYKEPHEEKGKRNFFRAEFDGGRWETYDDEKAELLEKAIEKNKAIRRKVKKLQ